MLKDSHWWAACLFKVVMPLPIMWLSQAPIMQTGPRNKNNKKSCGTHLEVCASGKGADEGVDVAAQCVRHVIAVHGLVRGHDVESAIEDVAASRRHKLWCWRLRLSMVACQ